MWGRRCVLYVHCIYIQYTNYNLTCLLDLFGIRVGNSPENVWKGELKNQKSGRWLAAPPVCHIQSGPIRSFILTGDEISNCWRLLFGAGPSWNVSTSFVTELLEVRVGGWSYCLISFIFIGIVSVDIWSCKLIEFDSVSMSSQAFVRPDQVPPLHPGSLLPV